MCEGDERPSVKEMGDCKGVQVDFFILLFKVGTLKLLGTAFIFLRTLKTNESVNFQMQGHNF